jgi:hypothetical protein
VINFNNLYYVILNKGVYVIFLNKHCHYFTFKLHFATILIVISPSVLLYMKKIFTLLVFSLFTIISFAQIVNNPRTCGTMHNHDTWLLTNPAYQTKRAAIETHTTNYAAGKKKRVVITIPVVFHVVWNAAAENLADTILKEQLKQLNLDYAKLNTDTNLIPAAFKPLAADCEIQFCLAVRDPNGNPTTGIERRNTTVTSFNTNDNVKFFASGGLNAWPADDYLNFWTCDLGSSLLGYAQFPGGPANTDGVVCNFNTVGSMLMPGTSNNYDLGRTATHEVGHWLNLFHIWGDDGGACSGSDQVGDTPNQANSNSGCPTYPEIDACATVAPGAMYMNYMDYVYDACMQMFTAGQKTRMQSLFATGGDRFSITQSLGCVPLVPCSGTPVAGTIASAIDTLGCADSTLLTATGVSNSIGIATQWQVSTNNITFTDISGATALSTKGWQAAAGTYIYYRLKVTCTNSSTIAYSNVLQIGTFGISAVTGNTICAPGPVSLNANALGAVSWYSNASATNLLFTGNPYNTSVAGATTLYAAINKNNTYSTGAPNSSIGAGGFNNNFNNGLVFTTQANFTIDTIYVYTNGAGIVNIILEDSSLNTNVDTASLTFTAAMANTKIPIAVNFNCIAGKIYKITPASSTVTNLYRNTAGFTYPYTIPNVMSIIGPVITSTIRYAYFYDWKISANCQSPIFTVPVNVQAPTLNITTSNILCNGSNTGLIAANSTGATSYLLNGGNTNTTGMYNNLPAGTYTVTGVVSTNCSTNAIVNITAPAVLSLSTTNTAATTGNNGSIVATVTGGVAPYTYAINGGSLGTTNTFTNLANTTYTVCVYDANGCSTCTSVTLLNPLALSFNSTTSTNACNGNNNGIIAATVAGGIPPYNYSLNGGVAQSNNTFNNLSAGTYTLTATSSNSLSTSTTIIVGSSNVSLSTPTIVSPYASICDGSLNITASGGVAPFTYTYNSGANNTTGNFTNLCAGVATICATDAQGCNLCITNTLTAAPLLQFTSVTNVQPCPNGNAGSITATATGGVGSITYNINSGTYTSSTSFNNLSIGTYTINAQDAAGHSVSTIVNLNQSASLGASILVSSPISCNGGSNGSITAIGSGGAIPYTYSLNGGTSSMLDTFNNLATGTYTITTTDGNGCTANASYLLTQPAVLQYTNLINNVQCFGQNNGIITVNNTGGTAPYNYNINGGANTSNNLFAGLVAGTYTIVTTDANNCTQSTVAIVNQSATILASSSSNTNASGGNNGSITVTPTGGTTPYSYSLNGGAITSNNVFSNLAPGTYTVIVQDAYGCKNTITAIITFPESIANSLLQSTWLIYPNPAKDELTISTQLLAANNIQVQLLDAVGKLIYTNKVAVLQGNLNTTINVSTLPKGVYSLVLISDTNERLVKKVMK